MRRFFRRLADSVSGAGQPPRKRALRVAAELFMLAAVVLLSSAVVLMVNKPPTRPPLATGVVFNVPLPQEATTAAATANPETTDSPTPKASPAPTEPPTPQPTWEVPAPKPSPPPSSAPIAKLMIPAIKVSAPISFKGVDRNGVMEDPNSWNDVAYYNFSGRPGFGPSNNAVFAGHVDYIRHGPAVFWNLNKLKPGDEIHLQLQDGTDYAYRVTEMAVYNADNAPVDQILGETANESVTLITCEGTFSAASGHYNNRLVVRAERPEYKSLPQDQISPGG